MTMLVNRINSLELTDKVVKLNISLQKVVWLWQKLLVELKRKFVG